MTAWLPLLPSQVGMLEGHLADPASSAWSVALLTELRGSVDVEALRRAILDTHADLDALRVRFLPGEPPRQLVGDPTDAVVDVVPLTAGADQRERALARAEQLIRLPWDITSDEPVLRHDLLVGDGAVWWLTRGLHAVTDGYGGWVARTRIAERYNHRVHGAPLEESPHKTLADVVAQAPSPPADSAAWWRRYLDHSPERLSPADRSHPVADHPHRLTAPLPEDTRAALGDAAGRQALWPYALMAAAGAWTARVSEEDEAVVGTPVLGRSTAVERAVPIQMMTVAPLRVTVGADDTLAELTARAVADSRASKPHLRLSTGDLFAALPWAWRTGRFHGPVVNVMPFDTEPVIPDVEVRTTALRRGPVLDLLFTVHPVADGTFVVECQSNRELYSVEQTRRHVDRLVAYLARVSRPGALPATVEARLPEEIAAADDLAMPRSVTPDPSYAPAWGEDVDLDRLAVHGLPPHRPRGYAVRDRRGRPCCWGQVGELTALTEGQDVPTGLLVEQTPDGRLVAHGTAADRRLVHGRYVEAAGVAQAILALRGVAHARCSWDDGRFVAEVRLAAGADEAEVREQVRHTAPSGCRLTVRIL